MFPKIFIDYFREYDRTNEVFVAMPFENAFKKRWESIFVPAIRRARLEPYKVDENRTSDSIIIEILQGIGRAKLILADISFQDIASKISGPNPNVMYELGIAQAIRLPEEVIVLRDNLSPSPTAFDILHIRYHEYNPEDIDSSISLVSELLEGALRTAQVFRDQFVDKVLNQLDPEEIWFLGTIGSLDYFDLYPFDPDRKGLYSLGYRESSEPELRQIARELIKLGVLRPGEPGPPDKRVYGAAKEYEVTQLGKALFRLIPEWAKEMED